MSILQNGGSNNLHTIGQTIFIRKHRTCELGWKWTEKISSHLDLFSTFVPFVSRTRLRKRQGCFSPIFVGSLFLLLSHPFLGSNLWKRHGVFLVHFCGISFSFVVNPYPISSRFQSIWDMSNNYMSLCYVSTSTNHHLYVLTHMTCKWILDRRPSIYT
jgi:hypothetical protein